MSVSTRTYYIKHIQRLAFDVPVFCEPTLIRLHPRSDAHGLVRSARLDVTPRPAGLERSMDLNGNVVWRAWFNELTISMSVVVTSCVDRFLALPRDKATPANCIGGDRAEDLALSNCFAKPGKEQPELGELIHAVFDRCAGSQRDVLRELTTMLAAKLAPRSGAGLPLAANCPSPGRLAEQLAEAGRMMDIPARLVRGYNAHTADEIDRDMQIWTEFYLPGTGWCGFDPLHGTEVDHHYIPVSTGRTLAATATISGDYRGSSRRPEYSTQIILREAARHESVLSRSATSYA